MFTSSRTTKMKRNKTIEKKRKKYKWKPLKCHLCDQRFNDLLIMRNHIKTHNNNCQQSVGQFPNSTAYYDSWKTPDLTPDLTQWQPLSSETFSNDCDSHISHKPLICANDGNLDAISEKSNRQTDSECSFISAHTTSQIKAEYSVNSWQTIDIEVRISDIYPNVQYEGQTGIIKNIAESLCSVLLAKEDKLVSILSEHLEPVKPSSTDKVKIVLGEHRGKTGTLLNIDGNEASVCFESSGIEILPYTFLSKMSD